LQKDFPQVYKLFQIFLAIPVTSVVAERSFSTLKRIKTYLRNTIGQARLSALAILNIEKDLAEKIEINDIIDKFAKIPKHGRTMDFF
jgi:hypothetical protein